jgi:hypothetical protein
MNNTYTTTNKAGTKYRLGGRVHDCAWQPGTDAV